MTLTVSPPVIAVRMDSRSVRPMETVATTSGLLPDMLITDSSRLPMMSAAAPISVALTAFSSKLHRPRSTITILPTTSASFV